MIPFLCLAQEIAGPTFNRFNPKLKENLEHLAKREQNGLAVHQRQHVSTEVALQRRELKQIVQHNLWIGIPAKLHNNAHPIAITFVTNVGYSFKLFVVNQVCNAFNQSRFISLVRKFGDDDRITVGTTG